MSDEQATSVDLEGVRPLPPPPGPGPRTGFPFSHLLPELQGEVLRLADPLARAMLAVTSKQFLATLGLHLRPTHALLEAAAAADQVALFDELRGWTWPLFALDEVKILRAALPPTGESLGFFEHFLAQSSVYRSHWALASLSATAGKQRNLAVLHFLLQARRTWLREDAEAAHVWGREHEAHEDLFVMRFMEGLVEGGIADCSLLEEAHKLARRWEDDDEEELKSTALTSGSIATLNVLSEFLCTPFNERWQDSEFDTVRWMVPFARHVLQHGFEPSTSWMATAVASGNVELTRFLLAQGAPLPTTYQMYWVCPASPFEQIKRCLELVFAERPQEQAAWSKCLLQFAKHGDEPAILDLITAHGFKVDLDLEPYTPKINLWLYGRDEDLPDASTWKLMCSALLARHAEALALATQLGIKALPLLSHRQLSSGPSGPSNVYRAWRFLLRQQHPEATVEAADQVYRTALLSGNVPLLRYGLLHGWRPPASTLLQADLMPARWNEPLAHCLRHLLQFAPEVGSEQRVQAFRERVKGEAGYDSKSIKELDILLRDFGF